MYHKGIVFGLLLVGYPAFAADTWLCIGEKGAEVTNNSYSVVGNDAFTNEDKWLLDENGLRFFGTDVPFLTRCFGTDSRPNLCEYDGDSWGGTFMMNSANVFTYIGMQINGDNVITFIVKGKCSKL